jgi:signal transduction histidine kinase
MNLATRLSAFFLIALAVVLAGFSIALVLLAESYFTRQMDTRLVAALETLQAAIDVESDGLTWHPAEDRPVTIGIETGPDQLRWVVVNDAGRTVAQSANYDPARFPTQWRPAEWPDDPPDGSVMGNSGPWYLGARRLRTVDLASRKDAKPVKPPDNDAGDDESNELILLAGLLSAPAATNVRELAAALSLVGTALWVVCALLGRRFAQRALDPLVKMATAARQMTAADRNRQLPSPETGDELEALGHAFNDLLGRMQQAIDQRERFAGDASHQLRTPLAGILSAVEVARRRERSAADYAQALDQVRAEALGMRQIVESLLFLARGESGHAQLETEPIELDAWLARELDRFAAGPRGADLVRKLDLEPPARIAGQSPLLAQALGNLLDNAMKYSPAGTPIVVRSWRQSGRAGFSVEDQGGGIAAEDLPHVFEPFYRSASARRAGTSGVGLGLAVVERIVTHLGGTITVDSQPGRFTRFTISFPEIDRSAEKRGHSTFSKK